MNTIQENLLNRRTIHNYKATPIPEGALRRALEAAIRAPNHKLTNPWRFTRLGPIARNTLTILALDLKCPERDNATRVQTIKSKFSNPAEIIVISQLVDEDPFRAKEDYAAIACAIQNMSLSLWSEGIGSKWSSGGVTRHQRAYDLAEIPEGEQIVGFLWVGIPEITPETPRPDLDVFYRTVK